MYCIFMRTRSKQLIHDSLRVVGLGGFVGVMIIAPNALQALEKLLGKQVKELNTPERQRIYRVLKRQGLIQLDKEGEGYRIAITPAGAHRLSEELLDNLIVPNMGKWDGHWRLVCYDIPSGRNKERYTFTHHLNRMGFTMLQKSMWVHPHECISQIEEISSSLRLSRYVSVMEVVRLDTHSTKRLISRYESIIKI